MKTFRIARPDDAKAIADITAHAGPGLTTVPSTLQAVERVLDESARFQAGDAAANRILFVIESNGNIMGLSSLIPKLGVERPFYSFRRSRHARRSVNPVLSVDYETLLLTTDFDGYTEMATLFLGPSARGQGLGRLASIGRLGYIEARRDQFEDKLMAEVRGWFAPDGSCPFWEGLSAQFIDLPFEEADQLSTHDGRFIVDLLPSLPILLNLLPEETRKYAGRANVKSEPALQLLRSFGFRITDLCDVFDGGPAVECPTDQTVVSRTSRILKETGAREQAVTTPCLLSCHNDKTFTATICAPDQVPRSPAEARNLLGTDGVFRLADTKVRRVEQEG